MSKYLILFVSLDFNLMKMGDEGESQLNENSEENPPANQDELILAQQRQIEKEVSEAIIIYYSLMMSIRFQKALT